MWALYPLTKQCEIHLLPKTHGAAMQGSSALALGVPTAHAIASHTKQVLKKYLLLIRGRHQQNQDLVLPSRINMGKTELVGDIRAHTWLNNQVNDSRHELRGERVGTLWLGKLQGKEQIDQAKCSLALKEEKRKRRRREERKAKQQREEMQWPWGWGRTLLCS